MSATYLDQSNTSLVNEERGVGYIESRLSMDRMDSMMEDIDEDIEEIIPKIRLGICAMNKKTNSQPMQEILSRISRFDFVEVIIFPDHVIKNEAVEDWPICDALISFYSSGFPLSKAIKYAELRKPFVLNDLEMQFTLKDRCAVYNLLESANIEMPRYAILMRDDNGVPINCDFVELEDSIQIGNTVFQKPFVEKPIDAEDHNVFIYFPSSAGGGSQRLFRKVGSRSSIYSAESSVRKYGSYIYEDFVHTDGTDVKIYTVGPEYAHAEARKSPSLDGKVERDSQGKEIRYPVILNPYEKDIAHRVCKLFKQTVCGFDLLRTHGKSYVCDVNGFSFVKTSKKYYDDCAQVLVNSILQQLAPQLYKPYEIDTEGEDRHISEPLEGTMLELRCVVGIIRHGDRTPKQKLKMEVRHKKFIELFNKNSKSTKKKLKLKQPKQLQEVLDIARSLMEEMENGQTMFEKPHKICQLKNVLEMYGHFSGINRKIQLKYLGPVPSDKSTCAEASSDNGDESQSEKSPKTKDMEEEALLLIMKWGGELTQAGREQAEELGRAFSSFYTMRGRRTKNITCIYPGGNGAYSAIPGCGLLRLHSTYRHDLKIYASDEGRVQMTAGAFAKGFLALEGELTPILVHLVRSDKNTTEMLDTSDQATKFMAKVKHKLHDLMEIDRDFTEEDFDKLAPTKAASLVSAMKQVKNPRQMCARVSGLVHSLTLQLKDLMNSNTHNPRDPFLYHDETLELMTHRWNKLDKDFKLKNGMYDISLIPDIYDSIKYDIQHNSILGLENTQELYNCAKALADIVIPQEYGLSSDQKIKMSQTICQRLLRKIQGDLTHADVTDTFTRLNPKYSQSVISPHRHVRTRLYFTSESHVHSVVNAMRYGNLFEGEMSQDFQWKRALDFLEEVPELNYMTQIIFMLYEDPTADVSSDNRFRIEIHFSPGAKTLDKSPSNKRGLSAEPKRSRPVAESHEKNDALETCGDTTLHAEHDIKPSPDNKEACSSSSPDNDKTRVKKPSPPLAIPNTSPGDYDGSSFRDDSTEIDNEQSRSTIGRGEFNDSTGSPISNEVFHESPTQDTDPDPPRRRRRSGLDQIKAFERSQSESGMEPPLSPSDITKRQIFSESDISNRDVAPSDDQSKTSLHSAEDSEEKVPNEDDLSQSPKERPKLQRARSQSTSCLESGFDGGIANDSNDEVKESQSTNALDLQLASQSTNALDLQLTSVNTMPTTVKSDSVVLDHREHAIDSTQRPNSSPTAKKTVRRSRFSTAWRNSSPDGLAQDGHGTLFYMPAIRAVTKKLSMQVHGAFRIRTPLLISNSRRPPVSEFYDQTISSVTSIDPLLTLHNSTPLRTMDNFLSTMTEDKHSESDVSTNTTPATTPTRKTKFKKLSLQSSTQQQILQHNDSVVGLDGLDMNEFR